MYTLQQQLLQLPAVIVTQLPGASLPNTMHDSQFQICLLQHTQRHTHSLQLYGSHTKYHASRLTAELANRQPKVFNQLFAFQIQP